VIYHRVSMVSERTAKMLQWCVEQFGHNMDRWKYIEDPDDQWGSYVIMIYKEIDITLFALRWA